MDRMLLEMNVKAASGEVSDGNKDHVTGTWIKDVSYYKVTKNLAKLCSTASW